MSYLLSGSTLSGGDHDLRYCKGYLDCRDGLNHTLQDCQSLISEPGLSSAENVERYVAERGSQVYSKARWIIPTTPQPISAFGFERRIPLP
jgi:hypothetical protein